MERWNKVLFTIHGSPFTKKAFTLAEVLITLGIIGVVAGMTIPTLMQNTQNAELVTKMKKEYSVLSNAHQQLKTENGGGFSFASGIPDGLYGAFKSKLSYINECAGGSSSGICLSDNIKFFNGGTPTNGYTLTAYNYTQVLVLKDGASMSFNLALSLCNGTTGTYTNSCGWILMDVNGLKSPNKWGKDIYLFYVFDDVIRPFSALLNNGTDDCKTGTGGYGYTCAGKYLLGN